MTAVDTKDGCIRWNGSMPNRELLRALIAIHCTFEPFHEVHDDVAEPMLCLEDALGPGNDVLVRTAGDLRMSLRTRFVAFGVHGCSKPRAVRTLEYRSLIMHCLERAERTMRAHVVNGVARAMLEELQTAPATITVDAFGSYHGTKLPPTIAALVERQPVGPHAVSGDDVAAIFNAGHSVMIVRTPAPALTRKQVHRGEQQEHDHVSMWFDDGTSGYGPFKQVG